MRAHVEAIDRGDCHVCNRLNVGIVAEWDDGFAICARCAVEAFVGLMDTVPRGDLLAAAPREETNNGA